MKFVKSEDLREGMRLAKPIYNRNGVMLYDRNSKLTKQGIISINNFNLIGIYILEPAEPVPPMSELDEEFERFQTMAIFTLKDDMKKVLEENNSRDLYRLANLILEGYGQLSEKIQFIQNLRSPSDYVYKHTLNVSILCAIMAGSLNLSQREKLDIIVAALLHDLGKLLLPDAIRFVTTDYTEEQAKAVQDCKSKAYNAMLMDYDLAANARIIVAQFTKIEQGGDYDLGTLIGTKILCVAEVFDYMTAMKEGEDALSIIFAVKYLIQHEDDFGEEAVEALIQSIQVLVPGVCVELTTGEKGLVIRENKDNILRPVVLGFDHNYVYNLSDDEVFLNIQIRDVMKTMDNRFVMDRELLKDYLDKTIIE